MIGSGEGDVYLLFKFGLKDTNTRSVQLTAARRETKSVRSYASLCCSPHWFKQSIFSFYNFLPCVWPFSAMPTCTSPVRKSPRSILAFIGHG
jgi:hypothetical protein